MIYLINMVSPKLGALFKIIYFNHRYHSRALSDRFHSMGHAWFSPGFRNLLEYLCIGYVSLMQV